MMQPFCRYKGNAGQSLKQRCVKVVCFVRVASPLQKVEAVLKAPRPCNVAEMRSFLGLVNYYNRFLPNLPAIWQRIIDQIGAVLSHVMNDGSERPIAFASRTLTKT